MGYEEVFLISQVLGSGNCEDILGNDFDHTLNENRNRICWNTGAIRSQITKCENKY